jgi:hypothetical protein
VLLDLIQTRRLNDGENEIVLKATAEVLGTIRSAGPGGEIAFFPAANDQRLTASSLREVLKVMDQGADVNAETIAQLQHIEDAAGHVLFYSSAITDIVTRLYRNEDKQSRSLSENELTIQEGYLVDWSRKLASALRAEPEDIFLQFFLDNIDIFHAERRYHIWNDRGESPEGLSIFDSIQSNTLDQLDTLFKQGTLDESAAELGIDRTKAADLVVWVRHQLSKPSNDYQRKRTRKATVRTNL